MLVRSDAENCTGQCLMGVFHTGNFCCGPNLSAFVPSTFRSMALVQTHFILVNPCAFYVIAKAHGRTLCDSPYFVYYYSFSAIINSRAPDLLCIPQRSPDTYETHVL